MAHVGFPGHARSPNRGKRLLRLAVVCLAVAVVLDVSRLISAPGQMQAAADAAAETALAIRRTASDDVAKGAAVEVAWSNVSAAQFSRLLDASDIHFGFYDPSSERFTIDARNGTDVFVQTERLSDASTAVSANLLTLVGLARFNIVATSALSGD